MILDEKNKLGSFLKIARLDSGRSVATLAGEVDTTVTTLSYLESGKMRTASEDLLSRIATVLRLELDEVLALADKVPGDVKEKIRKNPKEICKKIRDL